MSGNDDENPMAAYMRNLVQMQQTNLQTLEDRAATPRGLVDLYGGLAVANALEPRFRAELQRGPGVYGPNLGHDMYSLQMMHAEPYERRDNQYFYDLKTRVDNAVAHYVEQRPGLAQAARQTLEAQARPSAPWGPGASRAANDAVAGAGRGASPQVTPSRWQQGGPAGFTRTMR
jgi:hypothetical protein